MNLKFIDEKGNSTIKELAQRVRVIIGVPIEFLDDNTILSSTFLLEAQNYINKNIKEYEELDETKINISYIYYMCYLICSGMYARLPKQMKNTSTETTLQTINWDEKALEYLDKANSSLYEAIEDVDDTDLYGTTIATLSNETIYPNTINM